MTSTKEREYVQARWESTGVLKSAEPFIEIIYKSKAQRFLFDSWHVAFIFTKDHEEKIRLVREEIAWLDEEPDCEGYYTVNPRIAAIKNRILTVEQERLESLLRGFREVRP